MKNSKQEGGGGFTRRDALKLTGLAFGGMTALAAGIRGAISAEAATMVCGDDPSSVDASQRNSYFDQLPPYVPGNPGLKPNRMRITFLGSWYSPRITQAANSVFVEVGWDPDKKAPLDQFIFDCGSGVVAKYFALGIPLSRMDKVFITHLHGDHMSDLTHIYCFGPASDRKSPLYVWGPKRSETVFTDPDDPQQSWGPYNDGTADYCGLLREAARWHTESFSFQTTAIKDEYRTPPVWTAPNANPSAPPADKKDGYDLIPFELDWTKTGFDEAGEPTGDNVAYWNEETGVKITHFPAVHARQGSISYKLEWNGMSMIFTGDTKPNYYVVQQATAGVDVLIHEATPPPEVWVEKFTGLKPGDPGYEMVLQDTKNVQDSSHTEQKMFGYLLSLLETPPRLAVGTHFPASDDTIGPALQDIQRYYRGGDVMVATDFVLLEVSKQSIEQYRATPNNFAWTPVGSSAVPEDGYDPPKYWKYQGTEKVGDPYAQLDPNAKTIPEPEDYNYPVYPL